MSKTKLLAAALLAGLLSACGGGGGDAGADPRMGAALEAGASCAPLTVQLYGESVPGRADALQAQLALEFPHVTVNDTTRPGMLVVTAMEPWSSPDGRGWPDNAPGDVIVMQFGDADAAAEGDEPEHARHAFNANLGTVVGTLPDKKPLVLVKPQSAAYAAQVQAVFDYYKAMPTHHYFRMDLALADAATIAEAVAPFLHDRCQPIE